MFKPSMKFQGTVQTAGGNGNKIRHGSGGANNGGGEGRVDYSPPLLHGPHYVQRQKRTNNEGRI